MCFGKRSDACYQTMRQWLLYNYFNRVFALTFSLSAPSQRSLYRHALINQSHGLCNLQNDRCWIFRQSFYPLVSILCIGQVSILKHCGCRVCSPMLLLGYPSVLLAHLFRFRRCLCGLWVWLSVQRLLFRLSRISLFRFLQIKAAWAFCCHLFLIKTDFYWGVIHYNRIAP